MSNLSGMNIVLGISGGIAAYKAPILVRGMRAAGADVIPVLSANAHHFVSPTSLQAVAGQEVRQDLWDASAEAAMGHIELARWADLVIIAPATANLIARLANGQADDLLTTLCLATAAPVWVAPAMNQRMYQHPATQSNIERIRSLGYRCIGPDAGEQACGDEGPGRMTEPQDIIEQLSHTPDNPAGHLSGYRVMVTTGPTMEAIDPVRFISNHSSGLQGLSIAEAASAAGAEVVLVAGPGVAPCAPEIERIDVRTAQDMHDAVHQHLPGTHIFIGVAAVADYRPADPAAQKIKRAGNTGASMSIELVENPDIIASVAAREDKPLVIGFAAETNNTVEHAKQKRQRKGLDAIVLNDVSDPSIGFNSQQNAATLFYDDGEISFPKQSKQQLATALIGQVLKIFSAQLADTNPQSMTK